MTAATTTTVSHNMSGKKSDRILRHDDGQQTEQSVYVVGFCRLVFPTSTLKVVVTQLWKIKHVSN